jgi:hypothetical protein
VLVIVAKSFREWFTKDYLMQSPLSSQLLTGNKAISERQERICCVAEILLSREGELIENLRQEIATKYFVTMRCALDYINYATLFINVYKKKNRKV